jgi:predicted dienelactone hydrolase
MIQKIYFFLCCFFLCLEPQTQLFSDTYQSLGVQTLQYTDPTRNRLVTVELWYPTDQTEPVDIALDTEWIHPREIRNAPLSKKQETFPLLLMSHGHKGDRREKSWLAGILAKQGYIIASVDHYGDTRSTFDPLLSVCFWHRTLDFSFVLDELEKEPFILNQFDQKRIGFIGYSLGGMTGLGLAGAKAQNTQAIVLQSIKQYTGLNTDKISQIDFSISEKNYLEPRIKAALLICPAAFVYSAKNLKQIKIPIGLIATIGDEVLPHQKHAYQIIKHAIPKKLKIMKKEISHYSFLNQISKAGEKFFHKNTHHTLSFRDKARIHKEAGLFAINFFKETLKQDTRLTNLKKSREGT